MILAAPEAPSRPRRFSLRMAARVVRNPLDAIPPEAFHEPFLRFEVGGAQRLYLLDPELIHDAFVRHDALLEKGQQTRRTLGPALGQGLLTAEGAHWRGQRRAIAPVFQPAKLAPLTPAMLAAARRLRDRWIAAGPQAELKLGHEMMHVAFDIIVQTLLSGGEGLDVARVERAVADYLSPTSWVLAFSLLQLPEWTPHPGRARARRAAAFMRAALAERTAARRRAGGEGRGGDLLDLLLAARDPESGAGFDDTEIVDNLITFMAAGHETTALGLAWTLHLLERHPAVLARAVAEVEAVVGAAEVAPEHLERLPYVRQLFSEAMRLFPPAPIISREALAPFRLSGGIDVPEGAFLITPIYAVHRHAALWPDAERFDPDRFAAEAARARPRLAYMPFGAGPRVCIGSAFAMTEATAVLAVLLKAVELRGPTPPNAPEPFMRVTLRPRPDLRMHASPRRR